MSRIIDETTPIARKEHRCGWCRTRIRPGTRYRRIFLIGDDGPYAWIECSDCTPIVSPAYAWTGGSWGDGITDDEMIEWAREHTADPAWGVQATAFLTRLNCAAGW